MRAAFQVLSLVILFFEGPILCHGRRNLPVKVPGARCRFRRQDTVVRIFLEENLCVCVSGKWFFWCWCFRILNMRNFLPRLIVILALLRDVTLDVFLFTYQGCDLHIRRFLKRFLLWFLSGFEMPNSFAVVLIFKLFHIGFCEPFDPWSWYVHNVFFRIAWSYF